MSPATFAPLLLCCLFALLPAAALSQDPGRRVAAVPGYWSDNWRGWHFYEDPQDEPAAAKAAPAPPKSGPAPATAPKAPELVQFEQLQKRLEETRNIAIMRPTESNVRRYMELESRVVGQASLFADVAQRVAWATPELDPTLQGRPVNAKALEVYEQDQMQGRTRSIAQLGRDHVLFFFFRSDCPYCHAFAPTLEAFQARYGITVVPISLDGGGIPGFPAPRPDNGIARTLQVTQVPAVFLAQPFAGKIAPIGFGVLSESQLLERIAMAATPVTEATVPSRFHPLTLR
ncbi:MAG TPA: conjugal transfer protein TraF [Oxalobacteraceae bacterium]|nr:conjugal transfer protein TraF [Oxalobacteraceae bacterium]